MLSRTTLKTFGIGFGLGAAMELLFIKGSYYNVISAADARGYSKRVEEFEQVADKLTPEARKAAAKGLGMQE